MLQASASSDLHVSDFPRRWTLTDLATLTSCSRQWCRKVLVPRLVLTGALRKVGRAWIGRRSVVETNILAMGAE